MTELNLIEEILIIKYCEYWHLVGCSCSIHINLQFYYKLGCVVNFSIYPSPTSRHIIKMKPIIVPHVASNPFPLNQKEKDNRIY